MSGPADELKTILQEHPAAPFLFVGSGFSRRYLGLGDWSGLLQHFCAPIKEFGYYSSRANGLMPEAASYMAQDFNEWWWSADVTADSREQFSGIVKGNADALKVEIAKYLKQYSLEKARKLEFGGEIAALTKITVDGVITTNWDFFLEEIFPDYKVFVGQEELLFANPQSIGEIYKIHGSASDPRSLILTAEDYAQFNDRNPYLAAKLVTIFVEHPILFFGYSITDPHIRALVSSIAKCLPQEKIDLFQKNLIFVQRTKGDEKPAIEKTTIQSGDFSVTMMVAKFSDFNEVYTALSAPKRKMPARVLRFFKEQLYELVHNPTGDENKIAVIDYEEIGSAKEVEFVIGVGVAQRQQDLGEKVEQHVQSVLAKKGYAGVLPDEVFVDCLQEESKFDAKDLLVSAYPGYARSNRTFIPVFRYLNAAGIVTQEDLSKSSFEGAKKIVQKLQKADYTLPSYATRYKNSFAGLTTQEIIEKSSDPIEALLMLPFQPSEDLDLKSLRQFLCDNAESFEQEPYRTAYRKAICLLDRLSYGF
ncbi:SIR2 family protein [Paracoccus simplex]|uniref:SIR2 family protein n=1 Tax=Paracoccus simplex TaxID=2086346 RepID=A0ABV7S054_9RHOB